MRWAILGCGQMSSALVLGTQGSEDFSGENFFCFNPIVERAQDLADQIGGSYYSRWEELPAADIYLLGCKPQHFKDLASSIHASLPATASLLSIMAGVSVEIVRGQLGSQRAVVRVMPNRAALLGMGVHALFCSSNTSDDLLSEVERFIGASGEIFLFDSEEMIDRITGVSGSGPAYLFKLAEELAAKLVEMGISRRTANLMVAQTLLGASTMLVNNPHDANQLKDSITSKGGVTQAALEVLDRGGFDQLISSALDAAYQRTKEL